ncbi:DNA-directed RNA polymerase subunit alpha [Fimbriimonas ginsengisoli]|uniref:DNA-directed RNA polymerase subunit alpha n=1 Tax=Fimbriimonas ginsengisoli Gsoil 348 TaxID=661478 RepID=A0A068NKG0_FIMGI|nr:DNA-directed RNA polymerase subunit alpha [Fimbriimonas ginsengisoli]AIE83976.1 DNA-directed RNA polymerase subunit alpha [Fimbriimonas ginsengisoli Gsoil 348]
MPHISTLDIQQDYGKFVLEPLERGYGQTIGNALRRVLLSSIQGAAIAAIRVDKVFHEFAPIPGVKEDTIQLVLNLKDVAIRATGEAAQNEQVLRIDVKGPGRVTGADIITPEGVEVVNPEVYIATISDSNSSLTMEMYVNWGAGYTLPEKQERYKGMIGVIPTGSQYTPVKKVNYTVESTRVGMRTDYERLVLDVWTNGAVTPNDAISQAAHILDKYFRMFFDLGQAGFEDEAEITEDMSDEMLKNVPDLRIEELDFSQRTFNCLRRAGILNLKNLAVATESDLTAIRGFGKKSLLEVRDKLAEHGLELKPPKGGYRSALDTLDDEDDEDF